MVEEAAYFRALERGFRGGNPIDDWLAAEREINRLLPSPQQQKQDLVAFEKLRAGVRKILADSRDTLNADTIRQALSETQAQLKQLGHETVDTIDRVATSVERDMLDATRRMGARLENYSAQSADVFDAWRDRGGQFLARAADAVRDWAQQVGARLGQYTYRTGEMAAAGTLECSACGERVVLETSAHVPLCPKCRRSEFRRVL